MYGDFVKAGQKVTSRNGDKGLTTGRSHLCSMDGCGGLRLTVKWSDGKITYPCTQGMKCTEKGKTGKGVLSWKII